ncbi:MAG: hypothetical protein VX549_07080 [Pseudomonadota bacterium]|nr:hypothetical protein [Pseudomonadota bacterium]
MNTPSASASLCDHILQTVNALHIGQNGKLRVHSLYEALDHQQQDLEHFGEALGALVLQGVFESDLHDGELYLSLTETGYARAMACAAMPGPLRQAWRLLTGLIWSVSP